MRIRRSCNVVNIWSNRPREEGKIETTQIIELLMYLGIPLRNLLDSARRCTEGFDRGFSLSWCPWPLLRGRSLFAMAS